MGGLEPLIAVVTDVENQERNEGNPQRTGDSATGIGRLRFQISYLECLSAIAKRDQKVARIWNLRSQVPNLQFASQSSFN